MVHLELHFPRCTSTCSGRMTAGPGDAGEALEGDLVRVLTMGGATGRVVTPAGRRGGKLVVKVGRLVVGDLRSEDVVRLQPGAQHPQGTGKSLLVCNIFPSTQQCVTPARPAPPRL